MVVFAQIGIGTTTPDPSAAVQISSLDKGVLVPNVALSSINNVSLDGTNPAATGLLIYNTNASVTGGDGIGFYFFNGTLWEKLLVNSQAYDKDWLVENSTNNSVNSNDNLYTMGNVGIGKNNPTYTLDIDAITEKGLKIKTSGSTSGPIYNLYFTSTQTNFNDVKGNYIEFTGNGTGKQYGVYNYITASGTNAQFGTYNKLEVDGSAPVLEGIGNWISNPGVSGTIYGVKNYLTGAATGNIYGVYNDVSSIGNGTLTGTNIISTSSGTGINALAYSEIETIAGGNHYGVFSKVLNPTGYSALFRGRVSIGTTPTDNYIFPISRGTLNQTLQTNGTGDISWVDLPNHSINDLIDGKSDNDGTQNGSSIFLGIEAGLNDDSSDNQNVGIGYRAIKSNTIGSANTAIGYASQENITSGNNNTSAGLFSLKGDITGAMSTNNTGIGNNVLQNITNGTDNTVVGNISGYSLTTGSSNTLIGSSSGFFMTDGIGNTNIGVNSFWNANGNYNVGVGHKSLYAKEGHNNIGIGTLAGGYPLKRPGNANIYIGNKAGFNEGGQTDKLYIHINSNYLPLIFGDFANNYVRIQGKIGFGGVTPAKAVHINDILRLEPRTTPPPSPTYGDVYVNATDHHIYCFLGGIWKPLDN